MLTTSEQINELSAALAKAQGGFGNATKGHSAKVKMKNGGEYSYKYTTLADVVSACRGPLSENGLAFLQGTETDTEGRTFNVTTRLVHASGQWVENAVSMALPDGDAQSVGSAITYCKRYGLSALLGIATEDDDGASGTAATKARSRPPARPKAKPKPKAKPAPKKPASMAETVKRIDAAGKAIAELDGSADVAARVLDVCNQYTDGRPLEDVPLDALTKCLGALKTLYRETKEAKL